MSDKVRLTLEEILVHRLCHEPGYSIQQSGEENLDRAFLALRRAYELAIMILQEHGEPGAHSWSTSKESGFDFEDASCDTCIAAREILTELGFNLEAIDDHKRKLGSYPPYHIPGWGQHRMLFVSKMEPYEKENKDA